MLTDPPLTATFPVAANPTVATPNITECLHDLHLDVRARHWDKEVTCWLRTGAEIRQEQTWLQRNEPDVHHGIAAMLLLLSSAKQGHYNYERAYINVINTNSM